MSNESYKTTKDIAIGMYARRICGDAMADLFPCIKFDPDNSFDFAWVNECEIPSGSDHAEAWELFQRSFTSAWADFVKSKVR